MNAVPPTWLRLLTVGHWSPSRACRATEQEPQGATYDIRERRSSLGMKFEAEVRRIPRDRNLDVTPDSSLTCESENEKRRLGKVP